MLALYGHPFSSYTWKALIALYANATPFAFRIVDGDHPDHAADLQRHSPLGKFPLLLDGERAVFESTSIIEYLDLHYPGGARLIPADPAKAVEVRMLDRVFDNYVMHPVQEIVASHIRAPGAADPAVVARSRDMLDGAYRWIDNWLADGPPVQIDLVACSAAPALFYADWVHPIPPEFDRLRQWRAWLLALPPVARCVDEARPYRPMFPPGAPDRD